MTSEDDEERGYLELKQLYEAIMETDEELEPRVLGYMLFYVFKRSESHEKMQYS